jgi:ribonucleotide monophosphatase NagD (HAD superfamily)
VLERLGLPPERILAVGDSLRTDIAGAAGVDLAACWVLSGVDRDKFANGEGGFDGIAAEAAARDAGLAPVATLPKFAW